MLNKLSVKQEIPPDYDGERSYKWVVRSGRAPGYSSFLEVKKICLKALLKRQFSLRDESIASAKIVYVLFFFVSYG